MSTDTVVLGTIDTPIGPFRAVFTDEGLSRLTFPDESQTSCMEWIDRHMPEARVIDWSEDIRIFGEQLVGYLDGDVRTFDVPLDMRGTPFQRSVWQTLTVIPYGETRSYRWVAEQIGNPAAVRAVGLANGRNPVPVVVPCHRVIGSNGTLTGYGGGLPLKERLLAIEGMGSRTAQTALL